MEAATTTSPARLTDEQRLAELGYKQELNRGVEPLLQLRHLLLDHLGSRRVLHHLRPGPQ